LVETFNPETEEFTNLAVRLPSQLSHSSFSFVANGELCLLTSTKQLARWKIESEKKFRLSFTNRNCFSTQPPLVVGSYVLIANAYLRGRVEKLNLESYTFS
jgi:hypothetical protein